MTVDICMITYNHEQYIAEAIESVLTQISDFSVRLIIGEDNSKDNTRAICEEYALNYPDKILLLPKEKNLGMIGNFLRVYNACEGKYISFLEGDDYWTDPHKLQKQVDFLEANPDYSACFHNVIIKSTRYNIVSERVFHEQLHKDSFTTEDLITQWFVPTGSILFVNYPDFSFPDWFPFCKSGDIPFLLLISLWGKLKYIDEIMGVYRVHDKGISTTHVGYDKIIAMVFIYENFNIHTDFRFNKYIKDAMVYEINSHFPDQRRMPEKKRSNGRELVSRIYRRIRSTVTPQVN